MVQQALTIYTERIPTYLMQRGMLKLKPQANRNKLYKDLNKQEYEDGNAVRFVRGFLNMAQENRTLKSFVNFLKKSENQSNMISYIKMHSDMKHFSTKDICQDPQIEVGVQNTMRFLRFFYWEHDEADAWTIGQFKKKYKELASIDVIEWIKDKNKNWPKDMNKMINMITTAGNEVW